MKNVAAMLQVAASGSVTRPVSAINACEESRPGRATVTCYGTRSQTGTVVPGGPGGSGLNLNVFLIQALQAEESQPSAAGAAADKATIADYDWVGFDPGGVGSSLPAISCQPNCSAGPRKSYNPTTRKILSYWLSRTKRYDRACRRHSALQEALLHNMTTKDSARDMDRIRAALGRTQITYYGFSYGTYLGQVYASMFPRRVKRLIMDSNVDPRNIWYKANLNQDIAFNRNENIWFSWLAKYHSVYQVGTTAAAVRHRFNAEEAKLAKHPIGGQVGPDEWVDIFLSAGYYEQTWLGLGSLFSDWATHHSTSAGNAVVSAYQGADSPTNDNEFAVYNAVQCTDVQWPLSWAKWSRENRRVNRIAPLETWANAWFNAPCLYWPAPASNPEHINGSKIHNALLIDETLDAATPFRAASRSASCSRTRCCSPSRAARLTRTRSPATCAWTTPSPGTWPTARYPSAATTRRPSGTRPASRCRARFRRSPRRQTSTHRC